MRFLTWIALLLLTFSNSSCRYIKDAERELNKKDCASQERLTCSFANIVVRLDKPEGDPKRESECRASERDLSVVNLEYFHRGAFTFIVNSAIIPAACAGTINDITCTSQDGNYAYRFTDATKEHSLFKNSPEGPIAVDLIRCAVMINVRVIESSGGDGGSGGTVFDD